MKANQASFKIRRISSYQNDKKSPEYQTYTEITALKSIPTQTAEECLEMSELFQEKSSIFTLKCLHILYYLISVMYGLSDRNLDVSTDI